MWSSADSNVAIAHDSLLIATGVGSTRLTVRHEGRQAFVDVQTVATAVPGSFVSVATNSAATCAVTMDGEIACWGSGPDGILGTTRFNYYSGSAVPLRVLVGEQFEAVTMGYGHACALSSVGNVWCWGDNTFGQVSSIPQEQLPATRVVLPQPARSIAAGGDHSCAVIDQNGAVYCWGRNSWGQIGTAPVRRVNRPTLVAIPPVVALDAGGMNTCALDAAGVLRCWGSNDDGTLGRDGGASAIPQEVPGYRFSTFSVGNGHVCGVTQGGVTCWGRGFNGELGTPGLTSRSNPEVALTGLNVVSIEAGDGRSCAVEQDGGLWCWGNNRWEHLGLPLNPSNVIHPPTQLPDTYLYSRITLGSRGHSCALTTDNYVACWGLNDSGQGGTGTRTPGTIFSHLPSLVTELWDR